MAELFAGTSGFAYPQWKPDFYPPKLPAKQFLQHYAGRLNSVEINYTFRRTPSPTTVENWVNATPEGFRFSLKAPMRITHIHRLRNARESTDFFLRAIDPLRVNKRLGAVLEFRCDLDTLSWRAPHDSSFDMRLGTTKGSISCHHNANRKTDFFLARHRSLAREQEARGSSVSAASPISM